ncbi:hypothetical protein OM076_28955 [Solirubrobacter ginsenosidimutans]|uniref:Uncharacterized protein n=1 Tax=Solirubrobacter ginsenosidimutans TaxID=490573 RepID=A0A9X3MX34_9ACTN|nr:hypothetical protein [Solirubrobacter ginsenosidimutans]MDA0164335.1 hypothetical protein [Solirubrobacter ginsenosidimutans]
MPFDTASDSGLVLERWQQTALTLTHRHLELYSATVDRLADAHVEAVRATKLLALLPLAESHAAIWRECADTYVTTVRGLIER